MQRSPTVETKRCHLGSRLAGAFCACEPRFDDFPPTHDSLVSSTQSRVLGLESRGRTLDTSMGFRSRSDPGSRSSFGHVALSLGLGLQSSRMLLSCVTSAALRAPPSCVSPCVLASYPSQWFFLAPFVAHEHCAFNIVLCMIR